MTARLDQTWYAGVRRCGVDPDLHAPSRDEAWDEFQLAPFVRPMSLEELSRAAGPEEGVTAVFVTAVGQGSERACELLIGRCQPKMLAMVRKQLRAPLRSDLESSDVLQEVNVELMKSLPGFRPRREGALLAFLYTVIHHRICALDRARRRRPNGSSSAEILNAIGAREEHDGRAAVHELVQRALAALERKWPDDARALRLRLDGATHSEIAERMQRTERAVAMVIVRAKRRMARIIRELLGGPQIDLDD